MSESFVRILLSELTLVRLRCMNPECRRVCEVEIGKLGPTYNNSVCPFCQKAFQSIPPYGHIKDLLFKLSEAIEGLKTAKDQIEISFVLEDQS